MSKTLEDRIKYVMSAVFELPIDQITDDISSDNINAWDSLKHMNLVVALEDEFNVQFTDDNIIELINMKLIIAVLLEKLSVNGL